MKTRPFLLLAVILSLVLTVPGLAAATEAEGEESTAVTEEAEFDSGGAAVEVPPEAVEDDTQPWTSRFMYPLLVGGTVLLVVFLIIYYFARIKGRYEVVEG